MLALVPLFWVVDATWRSSLATLGRDQGIFQYIAWALDKGAVDYRDVRDVNGPLIHLIHLVFLKLGGADEHRFHVLELWATGLAFAAAGACLPGLAREIAHHRGRLGAARIVPSVTARVAWALAAWVALSAQYHLFLPWNQAQRESFCDWFLLPSVGLLLLGRRASPRAETLRLVVAGALSVTPWFGKPSFVVFTVAQLLALALEPGSRRERRRDLVTFVMGGALGAVIPLAFLFAYGDALSFLKVSLIDVPRIYRFIWARSAREILGDDAPLASTVEGFGVSALLLSLVASGQLPRRALVLGLMPLAGVANVIAQHKGFGYHFHPLNAFTRLGWLAIVLVLWERYRNASRHRAWAKLLALGAATALALHVASSLRASPHMRDVWILAGGGTAEARAEDEYLDHYKTYDFFPREMRQAAAYLRSATREDARVQTFGMDPYVLFHAERLSATPYIYSYDLDPTAALEGGFQSVPSEAEQAFIHGVRYQHEHHMRTLMMARPPEAMVFIDRSPLIEYQEAEVDFQKWCPETAAWAATRYRSVATFGPYHVWLRNDLRAPPVPRPPGEG